MIHLQGRRQFYFIQLLITYEDDVTFVDALSICQ